VTAPETWARAQAGDETAREEIILEHYAFVQRVAGKMSRSLPAHVDKQDLVSYGTIGLIRALNNFDPKAGVEFETYAAPSVRSVILDELRKEDWAPRSLRRSQRRTSRRRTDASPPRQRRQPSWVGSRRR
jgi:RNA polymerase sigma factor for flagellar operon FliA